MQVCLSLICFCYFPSQILAWNPISFLAEFIHILPSMISTSSAVEVSLNMDTGGGQILIAWKCDLLEMVIFMYGQTCQWAKHVNHQYNKIKHKEAICDSTLADEVDVDKSHF